MVTSVSRRLAYGKKLWPLLLLLIAATDARAERDPRFAFGPEELQNGSVRPDFFPQMTVPSNWARTSMLAGEFEMYFALLGVASASDLGALAAALKAQNMSVTFQVGGPRPMNGQCWGTGKMAADADAAVLRSSWINVGGRLDKIIVDNAFMRHYNPAKYTPSQTSCYSNMNPADFMQLMADDLADYFQEMENQFGGTLKVGVTDGLGIFEVTDETGAQGGGAVAYKTTDPYDAVNNPSGIVPGMSLQTYMSDVVQSAAKKGVTVDEFVLDFMDGLLFDTRHYPQSRYIVGESDGWPRNYGRLIAAEKTLRGLGVPDGIYWSAFPDPILPRRFHDLGMQEVAAAKYFGMTEAHDRWTYWSPPQKNASGIPTITGPESTAYTALNDALDGMNAIQGRPNPLELPGLAFTTPTGLFNTPSTVYRYMLNAYCAFPSPQIFTADTGLVSSQNVPSDSPASGMVLTGSCPITQGYFGVTTDGRTTYYNSNGSHYCSFGALSDFELVTGQPNGDEARPVDRIPLSMTDDGACASMTPVLYPRLPKGVPSQD